MAVYFGDEKISGNSFPESHIFDLVSPIVFDKTLTTASNIIEATNLDMSADGDEYEFILYASSADASDIQLTFNNLTTNYYYTIHYAHSTSTEAQNTLSNTAQQYKRQAYIGNFTNNSTTANYPTSMRGHVYFSNNTRKTISFDLTHSTTIAGYNEITKINGLHDAAVSNLTNITFKKSAGTFHPGSRLIVRRINRIPAISSNLTYIAEEDTVNGIHYIKYGSGRLECNGSVIFTVPSWEAWGSLFSYDYNTPITFPVNFIDDDIQVFANAGQLGAYSANVHTIHRTRTSITKIAINRPTDPGANQTVGIYWHAIGRWK